MKKMTLRSAAGLAVAASACFLLLGFLPNVPTSGTVFTVSTTYHTGPQKGTESTVMKTDGSNMKMTVTRDENREGPGDEMIYRGDRKEMVVVDNRNETYMVIDKATIDTMLAGLSQLKNLSQQFTLPEHVKNAMSPEQLKQFEEASKQLSGGGMGAPSEESKTEIRKTGRTADKAGYPCSEFEAWRGDEKIAEYWVTEWSNVDGSDRLRDVFSDLQELFGALMEKSQESLGGKGKLSGGFDQGFMRLEELGGFPVVARNFEDGTLTRESTLRSSTLRDIDPSEFNPPAGYKRQNLMMSPTRR